MRKMKEMPQTNKQSNVAKSQSKSLESIISKERERKRRKTER
jgi:hypothetical protein